MIESLIKPLEWSNYKDSEGKEYSEVETIICEYGILQDDGGMYKVDYYNRQTKEPAKTVTGFKSIEEAKQWAWEHYVEKMTPYLNADIIGQYFSNFTK